ncbi:alpha/beta hydrolase [Acinetobacter sp. ANC 5054]|uniref:alpha/beta hydrolase n=1 Tax=Acinetobacter sp. ANC 5054 TaxID=1977877 RepID=UPI000A358042|nr:alpha/beta hydrolase [Acinetobacter sp. ANC 5054]OTG81958.1 alpha/beta hydrolase [Acinetobacter sp. ANC 5054]
MPHKLLLMTLSICTVMNLSGCQNTQSSTKLIAGAFNLSTQVQKQFIDRHAPENVIVQPNIQYLQNPDLSLDIYQPEQIALLGVRPTVVWIHGGGWVSGSKEHARGYFKRLAAAGYNVVSVQYQFAPDAIYPTQLHQIDEALKFIHAHAAQYGIDANQLYLAGDSAGANMASHYAALVTNPEFAQASNIQPVLAAKQLKGLILHCGIYDLNAFVNTAPEELGLIEWGVYNLVQAYTGDKKDDATFLKQISTASNFNEHYPPVFISGGNKDFLTKTQSLPFVEQLKAKKVPVTEVFYPDSKEFLVHEYQFMMSKKASQQTFERTLEFITQQSILNH